ncbi:polysaccharide pyruvyl transferase family protein [Rhodococcus sp. G-MC3]|uniref:polysaccharide pyruvyl transferase family protein n=1 Tax=Rhodococcus sp. G-MC3 TaxID=3046209 RepID=UPI003FA7CD9F
MPIENRTRVLVLWADPRAENLGLQALAAGAEAVAGRVWGPCEVIFHTHNSVGTPLTKRSVMRDFGRRNGAITAMFRDFDVILDTGGGDSFTDIYGIRRLLLMSYVRRAAAKARRPLAMTPQTIGPFETRLGRIVGGLMLRNTKVVCTRDPESSSCARSLGRDPDVESTDMAFALGGVQRRQQYDVIVNVSGLLWNANPHVDHLKYQNDVVSLIQRLVAAGRRVSLLAHVLDSPLLDNDVPAVREAADACGVPVDVLIPGGLQEVREMLAQGNVLIGSRMHSAINALGVGTVAISWSYSRKFAPLMKAIGWDHTVDLASVADPVGVTLEKLELAEFSKMQRSAALVGVSTASRIDTLVNYKGWSLMSNPDHASRSSSAS